MRRERLVDGARDRRFAAVWMLSIQLSGQCKDDELSCVWKIMSMGATNGLQPGIDACIYTARRRCVADRHGLATLARWINLSAILPRRACCLVDT